MDVYVDVFNGTKTKFKIQIFASGVRFNYEVDKLESLLSTMKGLSTDNNLYVDERGVGIALADILDSKGIMYKPLGFQQSVVLKDEVENLKRELKLERARSVYWHSIAKGMCPSVIGSKEDMEYIMRWILNQKNFLFLLKIGELMRYIENIVIGTPIAEPSDMFALDINDWERIEKEKTFYTNERFLPKLLVELGIYPSISEIRRNKPNLVVNLDKVDFLDNLKVSKKRRLWILVGKWGD